MGKPDSKLCPKVSFSASITIPVQQWLLRHAIKVANTRKWHQVVLTIKPLDGARSLVAESRPQ
jgi:hypothetical protein